MLVRAAPPEHWPWLLERVGLAPSVGFKAIEAVDEAGTIKGMVGYCGWTANSVQCHMAVDSPIAWRSLLAPAFNFPFVWAGRKVLVGIVSAFNERSVRMTRHLGFKEAHRIRDGWAEGVDLIVFEMRREECRYLFPSKRKAA